MPPEKLSSRKENLCDSITALDTKHLSCRLLFQPGAQKLRATAGTRKELHNGINSEHVLCPALDQTAEDSRCKIQLPFYCRVIYYPS